MNIVKYLQKWICLAISFCEANKIAQLAVTIIKTDLGIDLRSYKIVWFSLTVKLMRYVYGTAEF